MHVAETPGFHVALEFAEHELVSRRRVAVSKKEAVDAYIRRAVLFEQLPKVPIAQYGAAHELSNASSDTVLLRQMQIGAGHADALCVNDAAQCVHVSVTLMHGCPQHHLHNTITLDWLAPTVKSILDNARHEGLNDSTRLTVFLQQRVPAHHLLCSQIQPHLLRS